MGCCMTKIEYNLNNLGIELNYILESGVSTSFLLKEDAFHTGLILYKDKN